MSPLSCLRFRPSSRTSVALATVAIVTVVAPRGSAVAIPVAAAPAVTQVLTVRAYADAHIQQATPSTNFGTSTTLQTDYGSGVTKRIYLKFVVSGVPADASLSVAKLHMRATNSSGALVSAKPGSHNNWSESGVRWSNAPVYGLRTDNSPAVTAGPVEWDLSSYVSGNGVYSVILTQASSTQTSFRSRESAHPPELELTYTTAGPSSDPVIVAAGDIACSTSDPSYNNGSGTATACRQRATSDLALAQSVAAVLALGDLQYSLATLDQFTRSYDPTWGRVKSLTRPVPGNHEYAVANASGYYTYFGAIAGNPSLGYYSYDIGTWHLVALNSNCAPGAGWRPGGCAAGSAQEQWLRQDLAAHANRCTLAYWHHPRYSSGHGGDGSFMAGLWQALYDARADVVLSGHAHDYERFAKQNNTATGETVRGLRQFVVGTGGVFFTAIPQTRHPYSHLLQNSSFGVLTLTLRPSSYDWRFLPIAGHSFTDSGTGFCH
jgi:acid phosphatase type 7